MNASHQVRDDLDYVRRALETARSRRSPASIYALWGAIAAIGFPLVDLAPRWVGWFWAVAAPAGFVASFLLGRRHAIRVGHRDGGDMWRHGLHWLGVVVATALVVPLVATGRISPATFGQLMLLLVAFAYFLAGIHLDRRLAWVSALLLAGYAATFVLGPWVWTITGVATATAFFALALSSQTGGRGDEA
jgi:hypothetical protein